MRCARFLTSIGCDGLCSQRTDRSNGDSEQLSRIEWRRHILLVRPRDHRYRSTNRPDHSVRGCAYQSRTRRNRAAVQHLREMSRRRAARSFGVRGHRSDAAADQSRRDERTARRTSRSTAASAQPNTCVAGFNSLRFDDEFIRFGFYRHFIDPYAREWQAGNSRWDIIDLARGAAALRPDGIEWPTEGGSADVSSRRDHRGERHRTRLRHTTRCRTFARPLDSRG